MLLFLWGVSFIPQKTRCETKEGVKKECLKNASIAELLSLKS